MNRLYQLAYRSSSRVPRASGDEPEYDESGRVTLKCSPRQRG